MTEYLTIAGNTIAYDVTGEGPLVVLAHGIGTKKFKGKAARFAAYVGDVRSVLNMLAKFSPWDGVRAVTKVGLANPAVEPPLNPAKSVLRIGSCVWPGRPQKPKLLAVCRLAATPPAACAAMQAAALL